MSTVTKSDVPEFCTTEQLAQRFAVHPSTLEKARISGRLTIPFLQIGRAVRYPTKLVEVWVQKNLVNRE